MALHGPFRRIITSHASPTSTDVEVHDTTPPLRSALGGSAAFTPLFATLGLPAHSAPTLTDADVTEAMALAPGVVTPGGVNAQVTDLAPNFRVDYHRTSSIDYNIFLFGSAYLVTPCPEGEGEGEKKNEKRTLVKAGEIVVQRGTLHAWEAGPEGARWCTVVVAAEPVEIAGEKLPDVDF